jgi:hypothetical protein
MSVVVDPLGSDKNIIDRFRTTFYKSEEMIQAFKEVGLEYTNRMWDNQYEEFQKKTRRTPEKDRIKYIANLKRLIVLLLEVKERILTSFMICMKSQRIA